MSPKARVVAMIAGSYISSIGAGLYGMYLDIKNQAPDGIQMTDVSVDEEGTIDYSYLVHDMTQRRILEIVGGSMFLSGLYITIANGVLLIVKDELK